METAKEDKAACGAEEDEAACGAEEGEAACGAEEGEAACGAEEGEAACGAKEDETACGMKEMMAPCEAENNEATCGAVGDEVVYGTKNVNEETEKVSGLAPIKKEFVIGNPNLKDEAAHEAGDNALRSQDLASKSGTKADRQRRRRGMNKERGKEMAKARAEVRQQGVRLCVSVVANRPCKYASKCTSMHSLSEYLAVKPPDLGPSCYLFEQRGECPFSHACRFAKAHTDANLSQIKKTPASEYMRTLNAESVSLQIALRKRAYDFSKSEQIVAEAPAGCMTREALRLDMRSLAGKPYLAPLTTVGNLPFRRLCVELGAEITCGEMGVCTSFLQGAPSEWSLVKRHPSEKVFGVQLAGGFPDTMARAAQIISENMDVDFIDINCGCPIEVVNEKGGGCALATRTEKLGLVLKAISGVTGDVPVTLKLRTGLKEGVFTAHHTIEKIVGVCPPQLITLHPRSKEQRYSKLADWEYTRTCAAAAGSVPFWACGDVLSYSDYYERLEKFPISGVMIGRGALIKPWIFTELKERRHWDISVTERLDFIQRFVNYGLDHWGSDDAGVDRTRRFLLEWLSFTYRYIPVGLLEVLPQRINERPPLFRGRNEMETLLASDQAEDWVRISEMFLGKVPEGFLFVPKHNANAYGKYCTAEG